MPGVAYYLACFYRRSELLLRIGFFINGACLAGGFGGLLAAGLSQIPRWGTASTPIHTWRNIFFFEGLLTILIGLGTMLITPSTPLDCKFLSDRDRYIAAERINIEYQETGNRKVTKNDVLRGMFNINTVICGFCFMVWPSSALPNQSFSQPITFPPLTRPTPQLANIAVQSLALFMPSILVAIGYTSISAQLHTVPVYTVATVVSLFMSWLSDRIRRRGLFISLGALIALTGYVMLATTTTPHVKYAAVFVAAIGIFFIGTTVLAWCLNNVAGSALRAVASAYVVAMGNFGSVIATWAYLPADAPQYKTGHYINMGAQAVVCLLGLAGIAYVRWENRKRENGERDARLTGLSEEQVRELGYRHPSFRYME